LLGHPLPFDQHLKEFLVSDTPLKLNYAQLALMAWFAQKPSERIIIATGGIYGSRALRELDRSGTKASWYTPEEIQYPASVPGSHNLAVPVKEYLGGGSADVSTSPLLHGGVLDRFSSESAKEFNPTSASELEINIFGDAPVSLRYDGTIQAISALGLEWWKQTGEALYLTAAAKRLAKRVASTRRILIGGDFSVVAEANSSQKEQLGGHCNFPIPTRKLRRPVAVATVIKETALRVNITDIQHLKLPGVSYLTTATWPISGTKNNEYISKDAILVDHFDETSLSKLIAVDQEIYEDVKEHQCRAIDEMIPIIRRFRDQTRQHSAMHDEMMDTALKGASLKPTVDEEPGTDPKPRR
jgi:hypothetical protein